MRTEQGEVGSTESQGFCGEAIHEVCGGVEALDPIQGWEGGLKEHGTNDVINGTNHTLGFTILRRRVRARHPEQDAIGEEKGACRGVIELATIVTLNALDGATELCLHIREKVSQGGKGFRFKPKWERPQKVRAVIKNNKIRFVTGHTSDGRGPQVTMN